MKSYDKAELRQELLGTLRQTEAAGWSSDRIHAELIEIAEARMNAVGIEPLEIVGDVHRMRVAELEGYIDSKLWMLAVMREMLEKEEQGMGEINPNLIELHKRWMQALGAMIESGATPDDAAEAMLTIAVSGKIQIEGGERLATRLRLVADMLDSVAQKNVLKDAELTAMRH